MTSELAETPGPRPAISGSGPACTPASARRPARAQARIALQTLIERLPGLRPAPDQTIQVRKSINVRGPLALDLRW